MERFGSGKSDKDDKSGSKRLIKVGTPSTALRAVFSNQALMLRIASCFVATEFDRPSTTVDYFRFAATCSFLRNILFVNPPELNAKAMALTRSTGKLLMSPLSTQVVDTHHNVTWRVTLETELCILVFYRAGIVREGVQIVASAAATMLKDLGENAVQQFIQGTLARDQRYFGTVKKTLKAAQLIDQLQNGTARIETIMYVLQCMGFGLAQQLKLKQVKTPQTFANDRTQVTRHGEPSLTRSLGITDQDLFSTLDDLEPHSSALGRREKHGDRSSGFSKIQDSLDLPFVGGPSGSSVAIYRVALTAGLSDPEHIRQFILATIAFLVGGGQHSIDECLFGLPDVSEVLGYQPGRYNKLLPKSLTSTFEWKLLLMKYKDVLEHL